MDDDHIVTVLPIHYSNNLVPNIHIHQFPLLTRPLQVPPSAALSGKRIRARIKPDVRRLEVHVPVDTRPEVWNSERGQVLGAAQMEDDKEKNQKSLKGKLREGEEPRLTEVRLRSEQIQQRGVHMLGIVRDGKVSLIPSASAELRSLGQLHLHPINETYQLRPTLTYLDFLSRKSKRSRAGGSDDDSDDGPLPDPDEPPPPPVPKKEKATIGEAREVQVSARKADDKGMQPTQGGLSTVRREMLAAIRAEEDETWQDLEYLDGEVSDEHASGNYCPDIRFLRPRRQETSLKLSFRGVDRSWNARRKSLHFLKRFLASDFRVCIQSIVFRVM
jgi:DNA-directed RNA polymerase-3 subunit RPC5